MSIQENTEIYESRVKERDMNPPEISQIGVLQISEFPECGTRTWITACEAAGIVFYTLGLANLFDSEKIEGKGLESI